MIVNGNANAKTGKKRRGRKKRKGAKAQGRREEKTEKKKTQRRKGARTQRRKDGEEKNAKAQRRKDAKKTGEPKPKKNIFTVPSYLQSRVQSWVQSSAIPFLIFFLAPLRLCAFAFFSWSSSS